MNPIVYRWDDGNAPVARGERRSLCDILYACLVTGYGSKSAAGWTREYVNATFDKAVFRNNPATGTGFYLQVDGAGAGTAYQSLCRGFEVMTDVDTGLFPFANAYQVATSFQANTTSRPWTLIADDRAFWFWCWGSITTAPLNDSGTNSQLFFGDLVSRYLADPYWCACAAFHVQSYYGTYFSYLAHPNSTTGPTAIAIPRPISGAASPFFASLIRGGGPGGATYPGVGGLAYTAGDPILISRPHLNDGEAYTFRGWLPGYYYPCHPNAFNQLATVTVDGRDYLSIRGQIYYQQYGNIFIALDDWRA